MNFIINDILMLAIGLLLLMAGIMDVRRKQISRSFLVALALVCLAAVLLRKEFNIFDGVCGLAIGFGAIGLSMASREQLGRGDGIVIAIIGLVLGGRRCLAAVSVAAFIMCFAAIITLLLKKGNRHTKLAFLPALFVGYVLCLV